VKVSIGYEVVDGPWGGGNAFVKAMTSWLRERGHQVVNNLQDNDIDIIMIIDPRSHLPGYTYSAFEVMRYQTKINPKVVVVHRINECDERKNTKWMNFWLRAANYVSDHTLFIADWLRDLKIWHPNDGRPSDTVFNGGDTTVFYPRSNSKRQFGSPFRLVTHHWGGNWMKGFDVYQKIDQMLDDPEWRNRIDFTYIGNLPHRFEFKNVQVRPPLSGNGLGEALCEYDGYITASICEPGGMHHVEAGLSGLPLLYRNSGALPEYCRGYGQIFNGVDDFEVALTNYLENWEQYKAAMNAYPWTLDRMCKGYMEVIERLYSQREQIARKRKQFRNPLYLLPVVFLHVFARMYDFRRNILGGL
jgi:hypothetical protein